VGKTHLAVALGVKAVEAGYSVLFLTLESLMGRLGRARHENRLERTLQQLVYPRVLILDELGYLPPHAGGGEPLLPPPGPPLRAGEPDRHQQQELRGLGRGLQRPGPGHRDPGSAPPSRHHHQHQGGELSAPGEEEGRAPGPQAQGSRPRGGGRLGM